MKNRKQISVLLALSGGVDSAVAALILKQKGYKVIAAFMKNYSDKKDSFTGECNWVSEYNMAKKIAAHLEIPLIFLDFEKQYKSLVLKPMFKAYERGLTPNPDTLCNTIIKFPLLWKEAKKHGCDFIATGHYARIKKTQKGFQLLAAIDKTKDQSYFLYELSQFDLSHTLFPVGNLKKSEVREIAKENHFPNFDKKSTSGICFIGKQNMKLFLKNKIKTLPGKVFSPNGEELGTHPGIAFFTIGERVSEKNGVMINNKYRNLQNSKLYVASKEKNNLIIAPKGHPSLKKSIISIKNFHLINPSLPIPTNLKARIRHLAPLVSGRLKKSKSHYLFKLAKPLEQIAPGQILVLYHNSVCLGGGEII
jgi:tRNA-uridine 2-sulfurtransferase